MNCHNDREVRRVSLPTGIIGEWEAAISLVVKARRDIGMGWTHEAIEALDAAIRRGNKLTCEMRGHSPSDGRAP